MRARIGLILLLIATAAGLSARRPISHAQDSAAASEGFVLAAPQGFGDRQNSWAWSMQWWKGHLYVGTNRAWRCAEMASFNSLLPRLFPYPPDDPDVACTSDPVDLPMQAEIWRWSAADDKWERVFLSPRDVPLADGRLISRDIGFRGMNVFLEKDGTEALYAAGVSPRFMNFELAEEGDAPPRLLRSTDGITFTPVPQDPGTLLGDFPFSSLRNQLSYKGRFYVIGGNVQGSGVLLEAENPAGGNDNFRIVSPDGIVVSAIATFNGYLYIGTRDVVQGFSVYRTDASGPAPYTYTPVILRGGYSASASNSEVLSMKEFRGHLYVGGNGLFSDNNPAELYRIAPDDSWDVVAGAPRLTPSGLKRPLSGKGAGFGNLYNGHMWRMEVFRNRLYIGTFDSSTTMKDDPAIEPYARKLMGFDLYETGDGINFTPVTTNGFGDKFSFGVRSLHATPYGLFLGTANPYYGLQIWRYDPPQTFYLPWLVR